MRYFFFRFARSLNADDVDITAQISTDLLDWQTGPAALASVGRERTGASSENLVFRSAGPRTSNLRLFVRFELITR